MKSNSAILMICLAAIAVSFATPKGSTRQSARIKDTTGIATSVSVRSRFVGTWELVSTEYRYADGTRRPYADVGPHGKGYLMYAADGHMWSSDPDRRSSGPFARSTGMRQRSMFDDSYRPRS